ncbi:MAG TPA: efflux RND transporter periplasmic adaptor subunit [Gemmatimonadaceae bacterium]|nr:efflux RND transporter periplasmic adaptor subunit [Gemmatimonadaceae bacterium]
MIDKTSTPSSYDRRPTPLDGGPASPPVEGDLDKRGAGHTGRIVVGSVVLIGSALAVVALLSSHRNAGAAKVASSLASAAAAGPIVRTTIVDVPTTNPKVQLIGEARPFAAVTLYAKVSGYLRSVSVDMGDKVKAGQVLAVIESPETDRAYSAAKEDYDNKQVYTDRVAKLLAKKYVSPEEADQARTEAAVARERLAGLEEQRAYESLRAPFDGTITARFADPGALVQNAASSQTSALPVVTVAQTDSLRVVVYLDQSDAASIRPGTHAVITMSERPGVTVTGAVARLSGQLDPKTRKMAAEIDVNDRRGTIVPGSFVQVELGLASNPKPQAPVEALVVRGGQTLVAVVDDASRIRFHPVVVESNDGRIVTFASGVQAGERLALSLGSSIAEGADVRVATAATAAPETPKGSQP